MDSLNLFTQALFSGAQAIAHPTGQATVRDAYHRLRTALLAQQPALQAILDVLEQAPGDEDTQAFVTKQLGKTAISQNQALLALASDLQQQIDMPHVQGVGVALQEVAVGQDLRIKDVIAAGDGVTVTTSAVKGNMQVSSVQAGGQRTDPNAVHLRVTDSTIGTLIVDPSSSALDAAELRYLAGLYAECNELPLANQGPVDATNQRRPRLQHVYVDLHTPNSGGLMVATYRLRLTPAQYELLNQKLAGSKHADGAERERPFTTDDFNAIDKDFGWEKGTLYKAISTPITVLEAIHFNHQLVFLGDPGGGKSTLTRRLAGVLASQGRTDLDSQEQEWLAELLTLFGRWVLPIRITLSRWASHLPAAAEGHADDLIDECVRLIGQTADLPSLKQRLVKRLGEEKPAVLLLLDGLDEVADEAQRRKLLKAVHHFCQVYSHIPLIITCRIRPWQAWQAEGTALNLPVFTIDKLAKEAIQRFVERWHNELLRCGIYQPAAAQLAQQRLLTAIGDPTRTDLADMAGTPLLLTMMARVNYERGLPDSRAELYEWYMRQLLWEWERTKLDEKGQPTSLEILLREGPVDRNSLERKLSQLAYDVHASQGDRDTMDIPYHTLREALEAIHPGKDKAAKAFWAVKMLDLLDDRTGLLRSLDHQLYQFSHRTFQEYLAARWLATGSYLKKFKEKIDDEQWGEVIALALGYQARVQSQYEDALTVIYNLFPKRAVTPNDWRRVLLLGQAYVRLLGPQKASESEQEEIATQLVERIPTLLTAAMHNRSLTAQQRLDAGLLLTRGVNESSGVGLDIDPPGLDDFVTAPGWAFQIGRYPVTNKQYKRFVDAGGYQEQRWWSKKGRKYKKDEQWTQPRLWDDPQWDRNSQPVVRVSWYEAEAYCAWLTVQLRQEGKIGNKALVRLPTEAEWMEAAHAAEGDYPWGKMFDPALVNSEESNLQQTSPVQMYKDGATSEGVYDLSGNVWEWSNEWNDDKYPWLTGGSFWRDKENVKSSARSYNLPDDWYDNIGFRCVVVPVSH